MPQWLGLLVAVLGGALAAGTAFYAIGRRIERRIAAAGAAKAALDQARLLDEARQGRAIEIKEEILKTREGLERELAGRRQEVDRRQQTLDQKLTAIEDRQRAIGRQEESFKERERTLTGQEQEARVRLERIAGLAIR